MGILCLIALGTLSIVGLNAWWKERGLEEPISMCLGNLESIILGTQITCKLWPLGMKMCHLGGWEKMNPLATGLTCLP